jgi:hypothetical protein
MEKRQGQLAPGFLADLVVIDEDLFRVDPDRIKNILPLGTMVAGEWVHLDPAIEKLF